MRWIRRAGMIAIFLGLLVGGWAFAGKNLEPIEIDYLAGRLPGFALWKVLLAAGALGGLAVWTPLTLSLLRLRLEVRRYRKENARMEAELKRLRPVSDSAGADDESELGD